MATSFKATICCIALAGAVGAFGTAALSSLAHKVEDDKPKLKFVIVNGTIPCVITYMGNVPAAISCKWDHIVFKDDDDEPETPKASWRA